MTDAELIIQAARGDRAAFESIYYRHWKAVYSYAWLLSESVADAEDVTQECFLALFRKPESFDPARSQLRTWLIAIARRQYLGRRRDSNRTYSNRTLDSFDPEQAQSPAGFDETLIRAERADAVRIAIAALPPPQREALYLFEFEELGLGEIAGILNIEPNAVKARLYRGREQLKLSLAALKAGTSSAKKGEL